MKAKEIIQNKIDELQKEAVEVQGKLQQVTQIKSQLQTRIVQIDGTLSELNEVLKNIDIEERTERTDTECENDKGSDSNKTRDNKNS